MKPHLQLFQGITNSKRVLIRGRLFRSLSLESPKVHEPRRSTFIKMLKRYIQHGMRGKQVNILFQGNNYFTTTGKKGLFNLYAPFQNEKSEEIQASQPNFRLATKATVWKGQVEGLGIISDIDDTILVSHAHRVRKGLKNNFFKSIGMRKTVKNVSRFYNALINSSKGGIPIFYVSSSVWSIYDYLETFIYHQGLPKGPLLLRPSLKREVLFFIKPNKRHWFKYKNIEWLLEFFPDLNFILVGDSGQLDAKLYAEIALKYPHRIKVVYIRILRERDQSKILQYSTIFKKAGIPFVTVRDMEEAARHASEMGILKWENY